MSSGYKGIKKYACVLKYFIGVGKKYKDMYVLKCVVGTEKR